MKLFVFWWSIIANAKNDCILIAELLDSITEPFTFTSSARCAGARIKPENNILTAEVRQRNPRAILIWQTKRWRCFAFIKHDSAPKVSVKSMLGDLSWRRNIGH